VVVVVVVSSIGVVAIVVVAVLVVVVVVIVACSGLSFSILAVVRSIQSKKRSSFQARGVCPPANENSRDYGRIPIR